MYQEEGILFLRSQNVYNDGLRIQKLESVFISNEIHEEMKGTQVKSGDVLLNITGGSIGRTCLVPDDFIEANVNQHVCILRFPKGIREYISLVMKSTSIQEQIDSCQTGGNREGLNFEQISRLSFCMPPCREMLKIIQKIKDTVLKLDVLEEQANMAISLMQERRTALISAAVTGKIDVRHFTLENGQSPISNQEAAMEASA